MSNSEKRARIKIENMSMKELLFQWELTEKINDSHISTVKGWMMDEFMKRNPEGLDKWLDGEAIDSELKEYMF